MANQRTQMGLLFVLVTMLWTAATAQTDCTNVIISMSPCLNYISGNSSTPSGGCCTQLASVARSKPECLCEALNGGGSSLGININKTQALALPAACNMQTPSSSRCDASSPAGSPAGTSPSAGRGSNSVPSTASGSSDGNSIKLATPLLVFLLFLASYTSTFSMF